MELISTLSDHYRPIIFRFLKTFNLLLSDGPYKYYKLHSSLLYLEICILVLIFSAKWPLSNHCLRLAGQIMWLSPWQQVSHNQCDVTISVTSQIIGIFLKKLDIKKIGELESYIIRGKLDNLVWSLFQHFPTIIDQSFLGFWKISTLYFKMVHINIINK